MHLLLTSELVVARDGLSEDIVKYVVEVIESYDSGRRSYSELSMRIKETAQTKLTRFNTTALTQMFSACCDHVHDASSQDDFKRFTPSISTTEKLGS